MILAVGLREACALVSSVSPRFDLTWRQCAGGLGEVQRGVCGPACHGAAGMIEVASWRMIAASGQAAVKARRTRDAVSMTRAPSLSSRKRRGANSALASVCAAGMASRIVSMSQ